MQREPAVAGKFYTLDARTLDAEIGLFIETAKVDENEVGNALSYVAPHAGYEYSGWVEGYTYKALSVKKDIESIDTFVLVGPNHTGMGYPVSISGSDWKTPLGVVHNDLKLSKEITSQSLHFTIDEIGHRLEHSIEVQLPFLQKVVKKPKCCFICMGNQSFDYCKLLSAAIMNSANELGRNVAVIASSDFNHYEAAKVAEEKDMAAINELYSINAERFHSKIEKLHDTACGYGPVTVAAMFAKERGARAGVLLKYANSGDRTKDYDSVVAYSSIAFV